MKKLALTDKPRIYLDVDQAEAVVRQEMMWHLSRPEDTPEKVLKAMRRVLKYYSSQEQYKDFMEGNGDWREVAQ